MLINEGTTAVTNGSMEKSKFQKFVWSKGILKLIINKEITFLHSVEKYQNFNLQGRVCIPINYLHFFFNSNFSLDAGGTYAGLSYGHIALRS